MISITKVSSDALPQFSTPCAWPICRIALPDRPSYVVKLLGAPLHSQGFNSLSQFAHCFGGKMLSLRIQTIAVCIISGSVHAGVMTPGRWEISTLQVSANGPEANKILSQEPIIFHACLAHSFVDKEHYTSPEFAMERLQKLKFECAVDARSGDKNHAKWQYSCTRTDGFRITNVAENTIQAERFTQLGTETTKKNDSLWSEVTVKISGQLIERTCRADDLQLN